MKKKREEKSPRILLQQLADLLEKWLKPQEASKVELCDQILLEQFLVDLDENTQRLVWCLHLKWSAEALQLAEDFDSAQMEGNQGALKSGPHRVVRERERAKRSTRREKYVSDVEE